MAFNTRGRLSLASLPMRPSGAGETQLVALPDALRETIIRRFKRLCDKCGCHNERELAAYLVEERQPLACPLACFLRLCGQLGVPVKLPACISLAVAGRDVSWYAL